MHEKPEIDRQNGPNFSCPILRFFDNSIVICCKVGAKIIFLGNWAEQVYMCVPYRGAWSTPKKGTKNVEPVVYLLSNENVVEEL